MRHVEIAVDYFVKWPVKVDGRYDDQGAVRSRLSAELEQLLIDLQQWWNDHIAVGDPTEAVEPSAPVLADWELLQCQAKKLLEASPVSCPPELRR